MFFVPLPVEHLWISALCYVWIVYARVQRFVLRNAQEFQNGENLKFILEDDGI